MKSLEPNILLALTTLVALVLLVMTASVFGEPGQTLKYVILAAVCIPALVIGNGFLAKRSGRVSPAMVSREAPATAVWAAIVPGLVMLFALVPVIFGGFDYGLLVIIGAVLAGVTVESAIKANRKR